MTSCWLIFLYSQIKIAPKMKFESQRRDWHSFLILKLNIFVIKKYKSLF